MFSGTARRPAPVPSRKTIMRWADWIRRRLTPSPVTARRSRARLAVHLLEDRTVPSGTGGTPEDLALMSSSNAQAANSPLPQLGDPVWKDLNANGFQDEGEPGIAFVTLHLFEGSTLVGTTTTNGQGTFWFNHWNVHNGTVSTADDGLKANTSYQIRVAGD